LAKQKKAEYENSIDDFTKAIGIETTILGSNKGIPVGTLMTCYRRLYSYYLDRSNSYSASGKVDLYEQDLVMSQGAAERLEFWENYFGSE